MLREEKIKIGDNEITIKETSFGVQCRLQSKSEITFEDIYRESMSKEDYEKLGSFDNLTKEQGKPILEAYERVNRKESPSQ